MPGPLSPVLLAAIWTPTTTALVIHLAWMHAPERLVGSTYVGLGCLGTAALHYVAIACLIL